MKPTVQSALFLSTKWMRPFFSPPRPTLLFICLLSPPNYWEILETYCLDILFIAERNCSLFESMGKNGFWMLWVSLSVGNETWQVEIPVYVWKSYRTHLFKHDHLCTGMCVFHCQGGWLEDRPLFKFWPMDPDSPEDRVPGLRSRLCLWASDHLNLARQGAGVDWRPLHFWLNPPFLECLHHF